jgi:ABC-type nickel/cobalt efflux system permease component RcnA
VVLLAAIKLHRIAYGMFLITAFSVGLASALIAIGLVVVLARSRIGHIDTSSPNGLWRYMPIGSAAAITVIGLLLVIKSMGASS